MKYTFRPLRKEEWDGEFTPARDRRPRSTFTKGWDDTMKLLANELKLLGAKDVVIEADFREQDLRLDGLPRKGARAPEFPGVRIFMESKHGPLAYQTDVCVSWEHCVRSIALGLGALRKVDLYGITRRAEQYTGFKSLPVGSTDGAITADDARELVQTWGEWPHWPQDPETQRRMVRRARARSHPDLHKGDHAHWNMVEGAIRFLRANRALP